MCVYFCPFLLAIITLYVYLSMWFNHLCWPCLLQNLRRFSFLMQVFLPWVLSVRFKVANILRHSTFKNIFIISSELSENLTCYKISINILSFNTSATQSLSWIQGCCWNVELPENSCFMLTIFFPGKVSEFPLYL